VTDQFLEPMDKCPDTFYKYRSLSNGAAEYVKRTICHNELYFAKPSTFNDPFDCSPSFLFEASDAEIISYFERGVQKRMPNLNAEQVRKEAMALLGKRNPKDPAVIKEIHDIHSQRIREKIGVLCLSEVNNDILMWSHYADSHRGICLEFDGYFPFFANSQQVRYPSDRPRINPFSQNPLEMMEAALLVKAKRWEYECEWRSIQYVDGPGVYRFPAEALTSLILGAQISPQDELKVIGWLKERASPLKLYRATPCSTTFSINVEERLIADAKS
jgi:hypothetical protein